MAISESRRRNNDNYNAKCDRIEVKPLRPIGTDIRNAAATSGQSVQSYIMQAVRDKMARDGFQPEADWPFTPAGADHE
jgi:hypothetical protein